MRVYELREPAGVPSRSHPWVGSVTDPGHRYVDFVRHPELIRTSLEDLSGQAGNPGTETLYELIEWVNGPASALISNDCALVPPARTNGGQAEGPFEASGRLMVLFRDLGLNTESGRVEGLALDLARALSGIDDGFEQGAVGVSIVGVSLTQLRHAPQGQQVMLSFWGWGSEAMNTWASLDRCLRNLGQALRVTAAAAE